MAVLHSTAGGLILLFFQIFTKNPATSCYRIHSFIACEPRVDASNNPICLEINNYLDTLNASKYLLISAPKSSATLFTTWGNEKSKTLPIKIKGNPVPTVENPTILGVTLDPLFNFGGHAKKIKENIGTRNNVLKTLAGSSWGKEKEPS